MINAFRHQRFLHLTNFNLLKNHRSVINAFRHQRFLHRSVFGDPQPIGLSDQRLSASKIFAPGPAPLQSGLRPCDQRLSASKIFAQAVQFAITRITARVINAFRHQRFLHRKALITVMNAPEVINAFRHQRFLHQPTPLHRMSNQRRAGDQRLSASKIFALGVRFRGRAPFA